MNYELTAMNYELTDDELAYVSGGAMDTSTTASVLRALAGAPVLGWFVHAGIMVGDIVAAAKGNPTTV